MRLPVRIVGLYAVPVSDASIILLSEPGEITRVLPIFIGAAEAQSIAFALATVEVPRPGTHDLMIAALEQLGARPISVSVTALREGAFIAQVVVEQDGRLHQLDARPSDGIALAVRSGAELFVENSVMDEAAVTVEHEANEPFDEAEIENIVADFHDFLTTATPEDFTVAEGERVAEDDEPDTEPGPDDGR